ncbi:hypothetical protein FGO68_gene8022 [Halteria grandinella]|uniref:Uncharacterized protein n=1 Tax=Halteria grandinella TaxID=5974 RepID=A0A8J8NFW0_HALGN|nr:hypothetical protein FGO68_gene8022 [Halteria grandinella]
MEREVREEDENFPKISELTKRQAHDESAYAQLLDVYVKEAKKQERADKERQKMFLMERSFSYSVFDIIFPYHMYLGHMESEAKQMHAKKKKNIDEAVDYQLTTLKTFNRRRMYLIWLYYDKFDQLLTPEERDMRDEAEHTVFKYNFILKATSLGMLAYTLFRKRPYGKITNFAVDFACAYSTTYCFLLSYVVGVYKAWPLYERLAQKMIKSKRRVDIEKDTTLLDDFKIKYYKYDVAISKFF